MWSTQAPDSCLFCHREKGKKGKENVSGFEAFSMLLVDLSYNGEAFIMDKVYYQKDFDENKSIPFDDSSKQHQAMYIFIDKFGNEFVTTRGEMQ